MAHRRYFILMLFAFVASCSQDPSESDRTGISSEDATALDSAAAKLDGETDLDQPVNSKEK
jgi:hypothetical protein